MRFYLSERQKVKLAEWQAGRDPNGYAGVSGGRWTYEFTPTSLGVVVIVRDSMMDKATIDLSDYEDW